jgi:hypothetical protein
MKRQIVTLACLAGVIFALPAHAAKKKHSSPAATPAAAPVSTDPGERLSQFLHAHLDGVLAPLGTPGFADTQAIMDLGESFADAGSKQPAAGRPPYQAAIDVCNALIKAVTERNQTVANFSAATAVRGDSDLGARRRDHAGPLETEREQQEAKVRVKEAVKTDAVLTAGQKNQWATRAAALRQNIEQLYARQREIERRANAAAADAAAAVPAPVAPAASPKAGT